MAECINSSTPIEVNIEFQGSTVHTFIDTSASYKSSATLHADLRCTYFSHVEGMFPPIWYNGPGGQSTIEVMRGRIMVISLLWLLMDLGTRT